MLGKNMHYIFGIFRAPPNKSCMQRFPPAFEAQQQYFPYCAILVAIASQNNLVLVFVGGGGSHNFHTICCKGGVAEMYLCETKYQGGITSF